MLENGVLELIELIRINDTAKFFVIPTEAIAAHANSKGKMIVNSTSSTRPRSSGRKAAKVIELPEEVTNTKSSAIERQTNQQVCTGI